MLDTQQTVGADYKLQAGIETSITTARKPAIREDMPWLESGTKFLGRDYMDKTFYEATLESIVEGKR